MYSLIIWPCFSLPKNDTIRRITFNRISSDMDTEEIDENRLADVIRIRATEIRDRRASTRRLKQFSQSFKLKQREP